MSFYCPTERLILRDFRSTDTNDLHAYLSLPEIYRFEPGQPVTQEQAEALCQERAAGGPFYAVELKTTGQMIGHLYFAQQNPPEWLTWELGYIFNPRFQNQGYCSEAVRALLRHAFNSLDMHKIVAYCNPLNLASWHVLENAGLLREGRLKQNVFFRRNPDGTPAWQDSYAYGLTSADYFAQAANE